MPGPRSQRFTRLKKPDLDEDAGTGDFATVHQAEPDPNSKVSHPETVKHRGNAAHGRR